MTVEGVNGAGSGEREAARSAASAPGLVPNTNNSHRLGRFAGSILEAREAFQIDQKASRLRRLRVRVEHAVRLSACSLSRFGGRRWRALMQTLTYRDVDGWSPGHVAQYLNAARMWAQRKGFRLRYAWVAELQQRGAVHYHVVLWVPRSVRMPYADVSGWWRHGKSRLDPIKGGVSGVCGYLQKYLSKGFGEGSPELPKGARMFGSAGHSVEERRELRYRLAPCWVRDALGTWADIRKVHGGWADKLSGEFIRSLWRVWFGGPGFVWAYKVAA